MNNAGFDLGHAVGYILIDLEGIKLRRNEYAIQSMLTRHELIRRALREHDPLLGPVRMVAALRDDDDPAVPEQTEKN